MTRSNTSLSSHSILDNLTHPVFVLNQKGSINFVNKAAQQLLIANGKQNEQDKPYLELCPAMQNLANEEADICKQGLQAVLAKQRENFQFDYQANASTWHRMEASRLDDSSEVLICHNDISELKQAEHRAELLLESPLDAMLLINTEGHIQLINSKLEKLFGYSQDELFGQGLELLIPHRFRRQHKGHLKKYFENPSTRPMGINLELFALARDGREFPVEISLNPLITPNSLLVSAAIRDISKLKEDEAELNRLGRILESSANEIYLFNAENLCFVYANQSALSNLAYDKEELFELTPLDVLHDYSFKTFDELLRPLKAGTKDRVTLTFTVYRKDASSYRAAANIQHFTQASPPVFMASVMDISEQERVTKALQESQERMKEHLENTPLAVIEWRVSDQLITTWNPASERLFGYKAHEIIEKAKADIIFSKEDKEQLEPLLNGYFEDEGKRSSNRNITKDGRSLIFEWYHTVIKNDSDQVVSVAALGLDVTSRQQALEALLSAQEEERARISRDLHDQVGQSLTGLILGLSHAKANNLDTTKFKILAETILADVRRISRDLRPPLLDELGLVPALKRLTRDIAEYAHVEIDTLMQVPETLSKDQQTVIYRVVQEALTNVVRHANASHASLTLTNQTSFTQLVIEDDGQGFDPSLVAQNKHFGLASMRERVELVGGKLSIDSSLKQGTTLTVRFKH